MGKRRKSEIADPGARRPGKDTSGASGGRETPAAGITSRPDRAPADPGANGKAHPNAPRAKVRPERMCHRCVFAHSNLAQWARMVGVGWPCTMTCVNHPDSPGRMREVMTNGTCRNFRPRRNPPVWTAPPEPPNEQVRHIGLTKGFYATVDAADYDRLARHKWTALVTGGKVYAVRSHKGKMILMHRRIMNAPAGRVVDHADGNGLNNCRDNLRVCTKQQNLFNSRPRGGKSPYKGVRPNADGSACVAEIVLDGRKRHLGTFDNPIQAAQAYDRAARELFGQYAHPNFPEDPLPNP